MSDKHIDLLMNDHALIEKGLLLLENEAKKGSKLNVKKAQNILEILIDYGDTCHNMKEEKVYFPFLLKKGMPEQGPVPVMIEEHKQEREYLERLAKSLAELERNGELPSSFEKDVKEYLELTKNHIWKENDILYPMGRNFISKSDDENLCAEFLKIENDSLGKGAYERYKMLIETLEKQSGGKVNLLESIPLDVVVNMLDSLPIELSFVDADDTVRYFNYLEKKKIFPRTLSVVGRKVQQCHPQKSVHLVNKIISEMKAGKREKATFWIHIHELYVHISYFAVRDENGKYQGCVEMVQDIAPYQKITGDKRLLDEK